MNELTEACDCQLHDSPSSRVRVRRAAITIFARHGYHGTGIRDIAREANIKVATLYHHMDSKEQLLVELMCEGQSELNSLSETALTNATSPEQRIATLVYILVGTHTTNPLSARVIDTEIWSLDPSSSGRQSVVVLRDTYETLWSQALSDGVDEGVFDIADSHLTRLALLTMCTGISNWYKTHSASDTNKLATHFVDMALAMLRARRSGRMMTSDDVESLNSLCVPHFAYEPCRRSCRSTMTCT